MSKFEFKVTKIEDGGRIWTHYISVRADEKLTAFARIEEMFPSPTYEYEFIGTC